MEGSVKMTAKNSMMKKIFMMFMTVLISIPYVANVASADAASGILVFGGNSADQFLDIKPTPDGGFVVVGQTRSTNMDMAGITNKGIFDALIVKYDAQGNVEWRNTFGGTNVDIFRDVAVLQDGGYVTVGNSSSTDMDMQGLNKGGLDAIVVKYDENGNFVWKKSFGGAQTDDFISVAATPDGGFVAAGFTNSTTNDLSGLTIRGSNDALLVKFDQNGTVAWKRSFGGSQDDRYNAVIVTAEGSIVVAGYAASTNYDLSGLSNKGGVDSLIVKYSSTGNVLWKKTYGGNAFDYFRRIIQTQDGGYAAVGYSESSIIAGVSNKGSSDAYIIKVDANGDPQWEKIFGGSNADEYLAIAQTQDGGYLVVGSTASNNGDVTGLLHGSEEDGLIVRYNSDGDVVWRNTFGGTSEEMLYGIAPLPGNTFAVAGFSNSNDGDMQGMLKGNYDGVIIKLNDSGSIVPFILPPDTATFLADITTPTNGNVTVTILYPADVPVKEYKIDDGEWTAYTGPIVMTNNGTIYARSQSAEGLWSEESSYVVSNIVEDEEDPVGEGPGGSDPEEPGNGNPIGGSPIACNGGVCNILPGMNKMDKSKFIKANHRENVDVATLVPTNYASIVNLWN